MEHKKTCLGMVRNGCGLIHLKQSMKNMGMMANKDFWTRLMFKTEVWSKVNPGNFIRKLDFPIRNVDGLEKDARCVGHMLNTFSKVGHMTNAQECQHHVSTNDAKCKGIKPNLLMSQPSPTIV
jgi:ABC-type antimicrobial peptide transport system ATPase subunit